ncbi:MAG: family 20 glycosylhydrolase [Akkermansia sp.]|nr:family 20 glycosylhydrolase [Akkermansia sp.]
MRKTTFMMMAALSLAPLMAENLQEIANNLPVQPRTSGQKLEIPAVPGAAVRLLGADYEQIIRPDGSVVTPLTDTAVKISFVVSKDGEEAVSRDYDVTVPGMQTPAEGANPAPLVIPALLNWAGGTGEYKLGTSVRVAADVPFAAEFATELEQMLQCKVELVPAGEQADIRLGITNNATLGKEGYTLEITDKGIAAGAATETGLYWATRSVLQMLQKGNGAAPCGKALDIPRYQVRSFLFDVGRLPIPMSYVKDVVKYMAWYKMNDLHIHLNDNYIFHEEYVDKGENPFEKSYAAFRLESDMVGADGTRLTAHDLSYTKDEFRQFIAFAKAHGVNIVPEFDTPAHALSFTRVRPDLIYKSKNKRGCEMLDASNPETLKFVETVFDEYLLPQNGRKPVFDGCDVVHVGADEFHGNAEHYRAYADGILKMVQGKGYTPRIWGSLNTKKGNTPVHSKGVQMNLWNGGWAKAWDSINQGFDVINTNDGALYIVPFAPYYRMDARHGWVHEHWKVNDIAGEVVPTGHPQLLGAAFGIWNDMIDRRYVGYGAYDIWHMITNSVEVLAGKMWGSDATTTKYAEHKELIKSINKVPGVNPYALWENGNTFSCAPASLPYAIGKPCMGPDYELTMELTLKEAPVPGQEQVLLKGDSGVLYAALSDGTIGFRRSDSMEFSFNCKLPVGEKVTLKLIGKPGSTQLFLNGQPAGQCTLTRFHRNPEGLINTFVLPLETLGSSFKGEIYSLEVKHTAPAGPTVDPNLLPKKK